MIKKIYRLKEKQVKKVLQKAKPFFSYNIVLNYMKNNQNINRYAIIISSKSVNTNVSRVYFRRLFYDIVSQNLQVNKTGIDFVFVVKKQTKLDRKDKQAILTFEKDIKFLLDKIN